MATRRRPRDMDQQLAQLCAEQAGYRVPYAPHEGNHQAVPRGGGSWPRWQGLLQALCVLLSPICVYLLMLQPANLDDRIKNPDQMITHDIQRFSTHLAAIYSNLAKPVLDVILYNFQLSQNVGAEGLMGLTFLVNTTAVLRALRLFHRPR